MSIVTRSGKGAELSWSEMDGNFTYLNSWDKTHTGGNVTYVPLTKVGKTQTQVINEAIADANDGDTLILASGTYDVVATDWDGDADIEGIVIDKSINLVGQGMQATIITCDTAQSDTIEITSSNVTISDMTINNTGHDTTGIYIYPEEQGNPNLTNVIVENIRINSYVADGANYGILTNNASVDIHDCEVTVSTINTSALGISLYVDVFATADITCNLTNNVINVSGNATPGGSNTNEGIRVFCGTGSNYTLTANLWHNDARANTVGGAADYGLRLTSSTLPVIAYKATVNAYHCTFTGTTRDVRVYGTATASTNTLNLYGCILTNGTVQGIGGVSGAPGTAIVNSGILMAKGIQVANNSAAASVLNVGTLRYRQSGTASYCEMSMQTGAASYDWTVIKSNTW